MGVRSDHSHPSLATEYDNGKMDGFGRDKCDPDPLNLTGGRTPKNFTYSYVAASEVLNEADEHADALGDLFDYKQAPIAPIAKFGSFDRSAFQRVYTPVYWQRLARDRREIDTDR